MEYGEVVGYLENLGPKSELGLGRVRKALAAVGSPQDSFRSVLVGGTNGKGSVSMYIAAILEKAGFRVGLFTSPYIQDIKESILINREKIRERGFASAGSEVIPAAEKNNCTQFEVLAGIAFKHFQGRVDYAVLEVGMGGRLDATNVVEPEVSVITNIALDHTEVLGETVEKQAVEKGGIIHRGGTLVTGESSPKTLEIFEKICRGRDCGMVRVREEDISRGRFTLDEQSFDSCGYRDLKTRMVGSYQPLNAAVALTAVNQIADVPEAAAREGILEARLPARFEVVQKEPLVILSAAHNPAGAVRLAESLKQVRKLRKGNVFMVMGFSSNKDIESMLGILLPHADRSFFTKFGHYKSWNPADYTKEFFEEPEGAVEKALECAGPEDIVICVCSLYMVKQVRKRWLPEVEFK